MYADDVVLMSHDPAELAVMLRIMDEVASEYGMSINASKTEIQIQQVPGAEKPCPEVALQGGAVKVCKDFKYLGSWMQQGCRVDKEVAVRRGRALSVFQSFSKVWASKQLQVKHKMAVYKTFVLPHFLYGAETWNCTLTQVRSLETAHSACLRRILGVTLAGRHSLQHVRKCCGIEALELMLIRRTFQWLGHVMRMDSCRYPAKVFGCIPEDGRRGRGRPRGTFRHTYAWMLKRVGEKNPREWLSSMYAGAQDRASWKAMLQDWQLPATSSKAQQLRTRPFLDRAAKKRRVA